MFRKPVDSSAVNSAGYDPELQILEVEFNSGEVYQYLEVPPSAYEEFLATDSPGTFINLEIKPTYTPRKM